MNISELIIELEAAKAVHGDKQIYCSDYYQLEKSSPALSIYHEDYIENGAVYEEKRILISPSAEPDPAYMKE